MADRDVDMRLHQVEHVVAGFDMHVDIGVVSHEAGQPGHQPQRGQWNGRCHRNAALRAGQSFGGRVDQRKRLVDRCVEFLAGGGKAQGAIDAVEQRLAELFFELALWADVRRTTAGRS